MHHLIGETVTFAGEEVGRDYRGRPIYSDPYEIDHCVVIPNGSGYLTGDKVRVTPEFEEFVVMTPKHESIPAGASVTVRGVECTVQPRPVNWMSPFETGFGGTEFIARVEVA